ncbi:MAG: sulfotransferase [Gemmataceae bacterium]|nr:sulfotransferase [Gemmataceae bacterium]
MSDESPLPSPIPGQQLWSGMSFPAWVRLLAQHRFAMDRCYWPVVLRNTAVSFLSSLLGCVQTFRYGREVARTPIREPPLFVLGFFRSGTTLLHDLLALDPRHTFPNTYECFLTHHFLLTEDFVTRRYPLQSKRVMDDVPMTWDQPQEDEFALCMLGQPSFYLNISFPNRLFQDADIESLPPRARAAWKRTLYRFLQAVTLKRPGRLVIKSPLHSKRIRVLLELFPEARFVHIVRDPYRVYASTIKMLRAMTSTFGLQRPTFAGLEELVLSRYPLMMGKLEADRPLVDPARFHEMHYEDLARDPVGQLRTLYDALALDGFAELQPRLEAYLAKQAGYRTNRYHMEPGLRDEISRRWAEFIHRYGYDKEESPSAQVSGL